MSNKGYDKAQAILIQIRDLSKQPATPAVQEQRAELGKQIVEAAKRGDEERKQK